MTRHAGDWSTVASSPQSRPRLTVVSAEIPAEQSTSGFAPRLRRFLLAAGESMDVTLALIDRTQARAVVVDPVAGCDVRVLRAPSPGWQGPGVRGRLARLLVQYPFDPLPLHLQPRHSAPLRALLETTQPDVVVLYLPYLLGLLGECPDDVPVVAALEEPWEWVVAGAVGRATAKDAWLGRRETARFRRLYRRVAPRLSAAVAISEAERDYFGALIGPELLTVIAHGVDTIYYTSVPTAEDARDIDVLVVGRLRAAHNLDGALRTWEAARAHGWRWAFVGEVDDGVAARLRAAGCLVTGRVADVRPIYARARCVLVPALAGRGVKTTALQAWATGRPLVCSQGATRGLPAVPGENLLAGDDPQAMAQQLALVLADPELSRRLGAAGRATAVRECDAARSAARFTDVCLRAAGGHPRRSSSTVGVA
jgi:glycosyltransferase involved in cell wall biosynthesis